jgi:hypothetical protein
MQVTLTHAECELAVQVGARRRLHALRNATHEVYGKAHRGDYWTVDIEAAAGELAVAKALGVFFSVKDSAAEDRADGDVAGAQVRHTQLAHGSLICHDRDHDDHRFFLVTGRMPTFVVRGWILGRDAKSSEYWREDVPRPAFFVPQVALTPLQPVPV